jgi:membrane protease subunit HflK
VLLAWLASGWYVVGGDEQAAVRRFGRLSTPLRGSGLHYDWPWPCARIDRVNLAAVRTLSLGDTVVSGGPLLPSDQPRAPAYLTGDKNLLLLRASVQYRWREDQIALVLFEQADLTERLRLLVEAELTAAAARCGVDDLQTIGLVELNQQLTRAVRTAAERGHFGVEIDQVTLERVEPPARVLAEFLDVSNARAESARTVHEARTYAEQTIAAAAADADRLLQRAAQDQLVTVAQARGAATRFEQLAAQLAADASSTSGNSGPARAPAIERYTIEMLQEALRKVAKRVVVDTRQPIDLHLQGP